MRADLKARMRGLGYLLGAGGIAVVHDQILELPAGGLTHLGEQIALGIMIVLGMLGGHLLFEGSSLFAAPRVRARGGGGSGRPRIRKTPRLPVSDADAFDTRSGAAMMRARRTIASAATRSDAEVAGASDRPGSR